MSPEQVCSYCKKGIKHDHETCSCQYCKQPDNIFCSDQCLNNHVRAEHSG